MTFEGYKQPYTDIGCLFEQPEKWIGKTTRVCGFIQSYRSSGGKGRNIGFIELKDGTCMHHLQILCDQKSLPEDKKGMFDELFAKAQTGVSLSVTGLIVKSPAKGQTIEMQSHSYVIYGDVADPGTYPISKNELSLEFLRTVPHLRTRTDTFSAIARLKSVLRLACAQYFDSIGFPEVQVPLITDNECESGANPFVVSTMFGDGKISSIPITPDKQSIDFTKDFFKKRAFLTVSGQLHLEAMVLGGLSKAWTMTTAFRAEPSTGKMHLAEFWMAELEFCFGDLEDNMKINEGVIKFCIKKILDTCRSELEFFQEKFDKNLISKLNKYATIPFIRTTHEKCVKQMLIDEEIGKIKFESKPKLDDDLCREHEHYITDVMYHGTPVFVCEFPFSCKAFYMPKINEGAEIERVQNFDLLFPGLGEVVGGSQRETDYDKLINMMQKKGINPDSLRFYSDLRKYGTVPHGGSGIGFDRLLMVITGVQNIRDLVPFPRSFETCLF